MGCGDGARYNSICLIVHLVHQSPTCQMKLHSVWIQIRYNHGLKFSLKIAPVTSVFWTFFGAGVVKRVWFAFVF